MSLTPKVFTVEAAENHLHKW